MEIDERSTFIDALASTLARLDEEAYKKAVLQDANSILENVILPLSFPWAHPAGPVVRTIPRDIDEMPAIQTIADTEHEVCSLKNNNFDLGRRYSSDSEDKESPPDDDEADFRAVARRADDPGVVELLTCAKPLVLTGKDAALTKFSGKSSILLKDPVVETTAHCGLSMTEPKDAARNKSPGELSYRIFEHVQDSKRRKLEAGMARLKTSMISFKVGSTSSRPRLFNKSDSQARVPLLLPAELPQDFRPMAKGRNKDRLPPGRSELVWMQKFTSSTSNRVSYKSYLTNEKVESGLQKRPTNALVGIRVNGKLLTSPSITSEDLMQAEAGGSSKRKREGKSSSVYSSKYVNEALEEACVGTEPRLGTRQCSLDTEAYTKRILVAEANKAKSIGWNMKTSIKSINVSFVTPRIDCFPTEDGLVHVLCSSPGELPSTNVDEVLNRASRKKLAQECTVCWRDVSISGESVSECSNCGILAHKKCCQSDKDDGILRWKCKICSVIAVTSAAPKNAQEANESPSSNEKAKRRSTRVKDTGSPNQGKDTVCCFCPHKGGSMSTLKRGGQSAWAHDVCRIWSDQVSDIGNNSNGAKKDARAGGDQSDLVCALCGTLSRTGDSSIGIVKCAASGCSLHFHPMCALYLSKCEDARSEDLESSKETNGKDTTRKSKSTARSLDFRLEQILEEDKYLCSQYSLRFAKCAIPGGTGKTPQSPSSSVLPVCFCGIHNPSRDRSLYGLYPGGKFIDEQVMRVPPKKPAS